MDPLSGWLVDGKVLTQKGPHAYLKINPNYFPQTPFFSAFFLNDC
jgi:hypothetical protein